MWHFFLGICVRAQYAQILSGRGHWDGDLFVELGIASAAANGGEAKWCGLVGTVKGKEQLYMDKYRINYGF